MYALVYTGTQKIDYREEKDPVTKPGESLIKVVGSIPTEGTKKKADTWPAFKKTVKIIYLRNQKQ